MADAQLDIVLSAKDMSQQAFQSLNKNIAGLGSSMSMFTDKLSTIATGFGVFKTIGQALESAKIGTTLEKQATAFSNLSDAAGTSSQKMLESLKAASQGMIAEADLMGAAGKALLMAIPADKISELMKIAAATSKMTGQSMTEAFNDITMGVARQSRMILDNLGIIVDVDKANQDYAKTLGKTADALTDVEKRQAFMNAVLKSGDDMIKRLGTSSTELSGVNQLIAAQTNLWNEVNKTVAQFLDKELSGYAKALKVISDLLKGMRDTSVALSKSSAWEEIEMLKSLEAKNMGVPGLAAKKEAEWNEKYLKPQMNLKKSEELKVTGTQSPYWANAQGFRGRDVEWAANTEEQNKAILKGIEDARKLREKNAEEELKWMDTFHKATMSEFEFERATLDAKLKEYDKFVSDKLALDSWYNAEKRKIDVQEYASGGVEQDGFRSISEIMSGAEDYDSESRLAKSYKASIDNMQKNAEDFEKNNEELWKKSVTYGEETMDQWLELTERTASAMQDNFSNLFFDAMTGELKTFEDYCNAVFNSIARMASDLAAQMATEAIFGNLSKSGGGGGGGGLLGWIGGLFGGNSGGYTGGNPYGAGTGDWAAVAHSGGVVGSTSFPQRQMPAWMIATAPRLHNGLAADEFPAVLQKGERVIPKGGGGNTYNMPIYVTAPGGRVDRESLSQMQAGLYSTLQRAGTRNT